MKLFFMQREINYKEHTIYISMNVENVYKFQSDKHMLSTFNL